MVDLNRFSILRDRGVIFRPSYTELLKSAEGSSPSRWNCATLLRTQSRGAVPRHAVFVDAHTVEVDQEKGAFDILRADYFVVRPGARPYHPPDVDFTTPHPEQRYHPEPYCSPGSLAIYGAGTVGCEYASMFRNMACG